MHRGFIHADGNLTFRWSSSTWGSPVHTRPIIRSTLTSPSGLDWACGFAGLFLLSGALGFLLAGEEDPVQVVLAAANAEDYRLKQAAFAAAYGLAALLLAGRWDRRAASLPLLALMVLPALSALWSPDPGLTLRRSLALWGTTLFGLYLGLAFTEAQLRRLVVAVALAGAVASAWVLAFLGDQGLMAYGEVGRVWQGAYPHKNILALVMALSLLCLLRPPFRPGRVVLAAGLAVLLVGANSATAMIALAVALACAWLPPRAAWLALAAAPALLVVDAALLTDLLGRDTSLTNRLPLWKFVFQHIAEQPWLGWGYGTFFAGLDSPAAEQWALSGLFEAHAHNGGLQVLLDVGLLGFAAFAGLVMVHATRIGGPERRWHWTLLAFVAAYNLTEASLFAPHTLLWVLLLASITQTARGDAWS